MSHLVGQLIAGRYQLLAKLGEGGMGVVYRALDRLNQDQVALKRVITTGVQVAQSSQTEMSTTSTRIALANEFQMLASLHHPHIINVLDYGFDNQQQPFFTMTLLDSPQPITHTARSQPLLSQVRLVIEMLQALSYLHHHTIIHRDLKPDNALVEADGSVRLLDFGLAKLREHYTTGEGVSGTLAYIAPEVLQGRQHSEAVDLYAAGIIAHEIFVGYHPFDISNPGQLLNDILYKRPLPDDLDIIPELAHIICRLLAKSPEDRYASAQEVIEAISRAVDQPAPQETVAIRESFLQSARFVGRDQEIEALAKALEQALQKQGSAWLIGGESGVGKSRLLDELRVRALVEGAIVLHGQAIVEGGLTYQIWREPIRRLVLSVELDDGDLGVLQQIVPDLSDLLVRQVPPAPQLEGQVGQQRLLTAIVNLFRSNQSPVVLILEDLQWAIESLEVLKLLNPLASELPLLIVANYRDDEKPDLPEQLPGMSLMKLGRLSDEGIRQITTSMLGDIGRQSNLIDLLKRETEGNAFFLVEVVRVLAESAGSRSDIASMTLPRQVFAGGMQQVIQRRLNRMPSEALPLLKIAAVAGRLLDLAVMKAADPQLNIDEWLSICSSAAVLDVLDERWRFAHDKLREGILQMLSEEERRTLHQQIGTIFELVYADRLDQYAGTISDHYEQAGDFSRALPWFIRAGKYAQDTYAPEWAIIYFRKALAHWALSDNETNASQIDLRLEIYERLGEMLNWQAQYNESVEMFEAMRSHTEALDDAAGQARAWYGMARAQTYQGNVRAALESALQSEHFSRQEGGELSLSQALWMQGWCRFRLGDPEAALKLAGEVMEISRRLGSRQQEANSANLLGVIHLTMGQYPEAARYMEHALEGFRQLNSRMQAVTVINNLGVIAESRGDYQKAFSSYYEALTMALELGNRDAAMVYRSNLGGMRVMLGDYDAAETDLRQVIQMAVESGLGVLSETYRFLAEALLGAGKPVEGLEAVRSALKLAQEADAPDYMAAAWRVLGIVAMRLAMPVTVLPDDVSPAYDAPACFAESLRIAVETGLDNEKARTLRALAQYELQNGEQERGSDHWQESRQIFTRLGAELEVERMTNLPSVV